MNHRDLEESGKFLLDFNKIRQIGLAGNLVVPAIAQDHQSKEILIVGYANLEALQKAWELKKVVFFSTSRQQLWVKGETSGDYLELQDILVNCEQNSVVYLCRPMGKNHGACHTQEINGSNRRSCFYRKIDFSQSEEQIRLEFLNQ